MKIVIFAADFKPATGGIAEYTHQIAAHLQAQGDEVLVLARDVPGAVYFDNNCQYEVMRSLSLPQDRKGFLARYRKFGRVIRAYQPDLILSNALLSEPTVASLLAKRMHVPYGIFTYGREIYNYSDLSNQRLDVRLKKFLIRELVLARADIVVTISHFTRELLQQNGVPVDRITLVPPAIDVKALDTLLEKARSENVTPPGGIKDQKVILTLSRLVPRKGIDSTLRALPGVLGIANDIIYLVAGDGPDRARLEQLCASLGLEKHVRFLGRVTELEKALLYQAADLFVMPNRNLPGEDVEGFGIVFLEANAYGKPVIAGRSGGAEEAVVDGETGLLVDPEDLAALSEAIVTLLTRPDYAEQLGDQGRQRVETELTWERSTEKLHQYLGASLSK